MIVDSIIKDKRNVVIHCSDGWDRTAQLSSLSQLLIEPYYRTLIGFIVLIEKDWIQFGHQFHLRFGHFDVNFAES
jgi:myotubularin-related protein 1/2